MKHRLCSQIFKRDCPGVAVEGYLLSFLSYIYPLAPYSNNYKV
jgi:hypothetical protein